MAEKTNSVLQNLKDWVVSFSRMRCKKENYAKKPINTGNTPYYLYTHKHANG